MEMPNYEMAALCITDQKYNLQGTSNDASSKSREVLARAWKGWAHGLRAPRKTCAGTAKIKKLNATVKQFLKEVYSPSSKT